MPTWNRDYHAVELELCRKKSQIESVRKVGLANLLAIRGAAGASGGPDRVLLIGLDVLQRFDFTPRRPAARES